MKNKLMTAALGAEAALCVLFCALGGSADGVLFFPLAPIGGWLRRLSLSGSGGNVLAIVIYVLICLLPATLCLFHWLKGKRHTEDLLLLAASAALFYSLYLLINPALAEARYSLLAKPALNGLVWVLIAAWLVLVLLRLAFEDKRGAEKCGKLILFALAAVYVFCLFYQLPAEAAGEIRALNEANTFHNGLGLSWAVIILRALAAAVPCGLSLLALHLSQKLLDAAVEDRYSEETLTLSQRLARFCRAALTAEVLLCTGVYLLQMVLAPQLRSISFEVEFPVSSVAVALAALLLSRLLGESKQLKEDNDLFV